MNRFHSRALGALVVLLNRIAARADGVTAVDHPKAIGSSSHYVGCVSRPSP